MTDGFTFFPNYAEAVAELSDRQRLEFYDSLVKAGIYGEKPEPKDRMIRALISLILPTLSKSVARMSAGKNGGESKKQKSDNLLDNQNDDNSDVCLTSKTKKKEILLDKQNEEKNIFAYQPKEKEKEEEEEIEKEIEKEKEIDYTTPPF